MSGFRKYDHVERYGHQEVDGLTIGQVHVFPKLDGSNGSVWLGRDSRAESCIQAGSRTRVLGTPKDHEGDEARDNNGFFAWAVENAMSWRGILEERPWVVYGEWMVPHTLKTYRQEVWRDFWVFDVWDRETGRYVPFDDYAPVIRAAGFRVVDPLCVFDGPSEEQLRGEVERNTYLIEDGAGLGEGIVLKNYEWRNQYGRQPWAKIVRNEFKEDNRRAFGTTEKHGEFQVEAAIAEKYVTAALVAKVRANIVCDLIDEHGEPAVDADLGSRWLSPSDPTLVTTIQRQIEEKYRSKMIPRLLETVFYELVREETWSAVKEHRLPTIDYRKLKAHAVHWTKKYAGDLF